MKIRHNSAIAVSAVLHGFKQGLAIGIQELESAAAKLFAALCHDRGIATGILHIRKAPAFHAIIKYARRYKAFIGVRALV